MRHIIDAIAAQGRGDDKELLHVTKGELAGLDALARRHFGRELPRNPRTGIKEASLFRDWLGEDVGAVADVAAPVAVAFIPGVGPVAATAMGAGIGAANQGLGKGGTTESAIMGGIAGGIGAYGGSGLAEGLSSAGTAAAPTAAPATTPIGTAGSNLTTGTLETGGVMANAPDIAQAGNMVQGTSLETGGQMANGATGTTSAPATSGVPPTTAPTATGPTMTDIYPGGSLNPVEMGKPALGGSPEPYTPAPKYASKSDFLMSKDALSPATQVATSGLMAASIPSGTSDTTGTGVTTTTNKTLPKAEVYYTPTGERRTRIVGAASGGLMGFADYDAADADAQGGYAPGGLAQYAGGGIATIRQLQPGGEMGGATADIYGAVQEHKPQWLQNIEPGGFMGAMVPGKMDWEDKQRAEEDERKRKEQEAAAQAKLQQEQQARNQIRAAQGGLMSMAKGRYLQGPGDGMSDSIHANIDGKQEARLATGEFVVPADVVSHLGNGDSTAGAKQLHSMMDRARMSRTGTKKQGKQINPRKVMPV